MCVRHKMDSCIYLFIAFIYSFRERAYFPHIYKTMYVFLCVLCVSNSFSFGFVLCDRWNASRSSAFISIDFLFLNKNNVFLLLSLFIWFPSRWHHWRWPCCFHAFVSVDISQTTTKKLFNLSRTEHTNKPKN